MLCARCNTEMKKSGIGGVLADKCPECGGIWLDAGELEAIATGNRKSRKEIIEEAKKEVAEERRRLMTTIGLCPKCQERELQIVFKANVELDMCPACGGLFFDKGELEKVLGNPNDQTDSTPLKNFLGKLFARRG